MVIAVVADLCDTLVVNLFTADQLTCGIEMLDVLTAVAVILLGNQAVIAIVTIDGELVVKVIAGR